MLHKTKRQIGIETIKDVLELTSNNTLATRLKTEYNSEIIDRAVAAGWTPFDIYTAIFLWIEAERVHSVGDTEIGLQLVEAFTTSALYKLLKETYEVDAENFLLEKKRSPTTRRGIAK